MDGIASVQARIQSIITQFQGPPAAASDASSSSSTDATSSDASSDFAAALASAQSATQSTGAQSTGASSAAAPADTGALSKVGVDPVQWAKDFLTQLGAPITASNMQAITAWEKAESGGGGGAFNPLNTTQDAPGTTAYNSNNGDPVKNYTSYAEGLQANLTAIQNGRYANILAALQQGNSAQAVAQAVANSPWGTGTGVERVLASESS